MDERPCLRGCTFRDTGNPVPALHGALLCGRCVRRLRNTLNEAPDLCAHLRAMVDPMRSGWNFDQESTGGRPASSSRPPMSDDLVDAADEVLGILTHFAELFGDEMVYRSRAFGPGTDAVGAYHAARIPAGFLLERLDSIVNDGRVEGFARVVIDAPADEEPGEEITWTIAKALGRWPLRDSARWASQPCPSCAARYVRIRPPRDFGEPPVFWCTNPECDWDPVPHELALWADYFGFSWHEHVWVHLPEMPAGVVVCVCGEKSTETLALAQAGGNER